MALADLPCVLSIDADGRVARLEGEPLHDTMLKRGFMDGRMGWVLALYVAQSTQYRYLKMGLAAGDAAK